MSSIVAILNLTPDSFSGDGTYGATIPVLLKKVDTLIEQGAAVIDIGAESTRPGAQALSAEQEWQRLVPLVTELGARTDNVAFSLDTYHPENAKRVLDRGFAWVNDVSGGSVAMLQAVQPYAQSKLVLMHSLSVPANKAITLQEGSDVAHEVLAWGQRTLNHLEQAGITKERIILDPGIGFGKTPAQSLALVKQAAKFKAWGVPVLFGHSRKSFLLPLLKDAAAERDNATLAVSTYLALQGIDYLRVHDVYAHRTLLSVTQALA